LCDTICFDDGDCDKKIDVVIFLFNTLNFGEKLFKTFEISVQVAWSNPKSHIGDF
jgi:hypothetical protein